MGDRRGVFVLGLFVILFSSSFTINSGYSTPDGTVDSEQKISDTQGNFGGSLDDVDIFGSSVANMGDLNGDGVDDLAVGAIGDDDGGPPNTPLPGRGAVWILFMKTDGTVDSEQKISNTEGNFGGTLDEGDRFGVSVANLGDLNGDGVNDLAVGSRGDDDGGQDRGAVWILFLKTDGTVDSEQKISDTQGNFSGTLDNFDSLGFSVANIEDLNGDGVNDLAVGAIGDDDGCSINCNRGAVWILFLKTDGTVDSEQKISDTEGNFGGILTNGGQFGVSVANLGDLNGDGVNDLAVGKNIDNDGCSVTCARGAVWILFMKTDGTIDSEQKISGLEGNFVGPLDNFDNFGISVSGLGDLNRDGVNDLAVGASPDDDGGKNRGAVWILFLKTDGTVDSEQKISDIEGNFGGTLGDGDFFGASIAKFDDLNGDGVNDLAVGASSDDSDGLAKGAVWILFLDSLNTAPDCSNAIPSTTNSIPSFDSGVVIASSSSTVITNIEVPPSHKTVEIFLSGLTDIDGDPITLTIDGITQDEPTSGSGKGDKSPDGFGVGTDTPVIRAERLGTGDGRVYEISFTADDGNGGECSDSVFVGVPHDKKTDPVDSGQNFDSTQP